VFKKRMLRGLFGPKRKEVTGGWRRLHNEELHNLYISPNIIQVIESRMLRWMGHVAHMGKMRNEYSSLVGKPEGKRPYGRHKHKLGYNIRMNPMEICWESVDWIHLVQDRAVVMNLQVL
jgi:hypothetical protein